MKNPRIALIAAAAAVLLGGCAVVPVHPGYDYPPVVVGPPTVAVVPAPVFVPGYRVYRPHWGHRHWHGHWHGHHRHRW